METNINSLDEMREYAEVFVDDIDPDLDQATVVFLRGDLGSGKTTFTQFVGATLGIKDKITSPTFVIMKKYALENQMFETLVHIDAYRLDSADQMHPLKFQAELADPGNLILIEWPEKIAEALPKGIELKFEFVDDTTRKITQ